MSGSDIRVSAAQGIVSTMATHPEDLTWWLRTAEQLAWIWARTYADSAPHDYVVLGRTAGLTRQDFVRAAKVIHTFGEPGRFYRSTNIYLTHGRYRWWTMDADLDDTNLINRAVNDRVYGVQDAPRTYSTAFTEFDPIGAEFDKLHPPDKDRYASLQSRIHAHFGDHSPTVLHIGCGTGQILDCTSLDPQKDTGIDPSQAMLNRLVMKHPRVDRLLPGRFENIPDAMLGESYDLVLVSLDAGTERLGGLHARTGLILPLRANPRV